MNSTVYLFGGISGNSEEKHFQFPDDYTSTVFRKYVGISSNGTVLAVSFDNSLVYHIYCKDTANGYFGFGVLLNGCWVKGQQKMLSVFSDAYVDAVSSGKVLSINDKGAVQCDTYAIKQDEQETTRITERLRSIINTLSPYTESLPIIDVSTNPNFIHKLPNNATDNDWRNSIGKYRSQYSIYGDVKSNFSHVLERLQNTIQEKERYIAKCNSLQEEIAKINKQKKQYRTVIILSVILLIGAIVAIASISGKNREIEERNGKIESLESDIDSKNSRISNLQQDYNSLENKYDNVISTYPFEISDIKIGIVDYNDNVETDYGYTLYDYNTMYLKPKIYYNGFVSGSREIKIKWYTPSGEIKRGTSSPIGYSTSESVYFYTGSNEATLTGWGNSTRGHWSSGTYRIEIWYNNMCLKSKTFTIY